MTEEEAIQLYLMQSDPMARATNDYGQGAGFLGLESQPESWDRIGEKNDLYSDLFRMTRTYLPDFVEGLNPTVEDPGMYQGYRSDKADLYRNNPAYAQLEAAMAEGASFDEAVRLIAGNKEFAQYLPQDDIGRPDAQGFRQSAEGYVSERSREGREFDAYDAEKQAYDDFVRPRTGLDFSPGGLTKLRTTDPTKLVAPAKKAGSVAEIAKSRQAAKITPPKNADAIPADIQQRIAYVNRPESKSRLANNKLYNDTAIAAHESNKRKKESIKSVSKKQENQAKLVRAYNMLMYGE
jgi:hypothetical protein